jgi:hypothetical protein
MNTLGLYLKPCLFELFEFVMEFLEVSPKLKDNFGSVKIEETYLKLKVGLVNFIEHKERFNRISDQVLALGLALVLIRILDLD